MEYIKHKENIYINKTRGLPITDISFLIKIVEDEGKWHEVRERDIITFSRYIDGFALHGELGFFKNHKIKNKKFKGLE